MNTDYLANWDTKKEQQKAQFTEHMYRCSGRTNGLFTGLWHEFCLNEAGPLAREQFFEKLEAIRKFEELQRIPVAQKEVSMAKELFITNFHD
tara:strand:+ start:12403 stop:12678 length:276 start_codon:yes stop_codon:yes gene_type:complete